MPVPISYRLTDDDLAQIDAKVRKAIEPLLDSLQMTIPTLVNILTKGVTTDNILEDLLTIQITPFVTGADPNSIFPLLVSSKVVSYPKIFQIINCTPAKPTTPITTLPAFGPWSLTDKGGVLISRIDNLVPNAKYNLTVYFR